MAELVCDGSGNIAVSEIIDAINDNSDRLGAWDSNIEYEVGAFIYNATDGFYYQALVTNTGSQPVVGSDNWARWSPVNYFEVDLTRTVGATGDYVTLDLALEAVSRWVSVDGAVLTLEIEDGHVIDYPINREVKVEGIIITYAGAGSLVINYNNYAISDSNNSFIRIGGEVVTFKDLSLSLTGSLNTSAFTGNWIFSIRGSIGFDTCNININVTYTNHGALVFYLSGLVVDTDIIVTNINSPVGHNVYVLFLSKDSGGINVNVDANNQTLYAPVAIGDNNSYFNDIILSNAANCTYGLLLHRTTNAVIVDCNFRKGVSDEESDIHFLGAIAYVDAIGGSNVQIGTFSQYGTRF